MAIVTASAFNLGRYHFTRKTLKVGNLHDDPEGLVSVVSHDLKGPLTAIQISVDFIRHMLRFELGANEKKLLLSRLEGVEHSTNQALSLIRGLLDARKLEMGNFQIELNTVNAAAIIDNCVKIYQPIADRKHIKIIETIKYKDDLRADEERLKQVVCNLLGNAVEHVPEHTSVVIGNCLVDGKIRYFVSDSGRGINPEDQAHLFELYWQSPESKGKGLGSGIGLAIAKAIVEAHHGQIWVESIPGIGTTFFFTLPIDE